MDVSYGVNDLTGSKIDFGPDGNWYEMAYSYVSDRSQPRDTWINEAIRLSKIDTTKYHVMAVVNANVDAGGDSENMVLTIGGAWGQRNWKQCTKCQELILVDGSPGSCHAGGQHAVRTDEFVWNYSMALNLSTFPGENNWRYCKKCKGLSFAAGVCPGGGEHDRTDTGVYTIGTGDPTRTKGPKDDPGVGHIYLGYAKREGSILLFAFVVSFGAGAGVLLPFPLSGLVTLVYWIWQIYDAYKHYKKIFPPDYFMIISTTGI